jgi:tetraacyldisaccharide 4'-kinase
MLRNFLGALQRIIEPLSWPYAAVGWVRNELYNKNYYQTYESSVPTINVGNLTVGGTGKTPHIEYLIRLLMVRYQLATLSRGYGRKTTGFIEVNPHSTPGEVGDEPLQLYQKFGEQVRVFVCEKRAEGLQRIQDLYPDLQLILLDDAFQHRAVRPTVNILLSDYNRPFYRDFVLPVGRLREVRAGAQRADAVVVTKCPLTWQDAADRQAIVDAIKRYTRPHTAVFFSTIGYQTPVAYSREMPHPVPMRFWLASGIARPEPFAQAAQERYDIVGQSVFSDHHPFTKREVEQLLAKSPDVPVLTTEKDWVKLAPLVKAMNAESRFYYWPIRVHLDQDFDQFIQASIP